MVNKPSCLRKTCGKRWAKNSDNFHKFFFRIWKVCLYCRKEATQRRLFSDQVIRTSLCVIFMSSSICFLLSNPTVGKPLHSDIFCGSIVLPVANFMLKTCLFSLYWTISFVLSLIFGDHYKTISSDPRHFVHGNYRNAVKGCLKPCNHWHYSIKKGYYTVTVTARSESWPKQWLKQALLKYRCILTSQCQEMKRKRKITGPETHFVLVAHDRMDAY